MQAALGLSPTMEPESRLHIYKYYYASCPRALSHNRTLEKDSVSLGSKPSHGLCLFKRLAKK